MSDKRGGGSSGSNANNNNNEVVVMVDNPPPGPPMLISIGGLIQVERERSREVSGSRTMDGCIAMIQGLRICPLPLPELDLDHYLVSTFGSKACAHLHMTRCHHPRGQVIVEPFTSSSRGDFILRYHSGENTSHPATVVRRSHSDFEWLNEILKSHKRPGHGHLCGRILPPFPSKQGYNISSNSSNPALGQRDVGKRAMGVAKSGVGMITSMAKSIWGSYASTATVDASLTSSTAKKMETQRGSMSSAGSKVHWLGSTREEDVPVEVAHRIERYLNYLLENPALSTSFPLNAIIKV